MQSAQKRKRTFYYGIHDVSHSGMGQVIEGNWDRALELIAGITRSTGKGPRYKKFFFEGDAKYFVRWGAAPPEPTELSMSPNALAVHTDGSASMDMHGNRRAGIGVYFSPGHPLNVAEPFVVEPLTNNRAELTAIRRAMEIIADPDNAAHFPSPAEKPHVVIYTDNKYSKDALGDWRALWERTNFKDETILNRDVIEPIWHIMDTFTDKTGRDLAIVWVKGHAGNRLNEAADRLADQGARKST